MSEITIEAVTWLCLICIVLCLFSCGYVLAAGVLVRRFVRFSSQVSQHCPSITILKPLCGAETHLYDNLKSFCDQAYAGRVEIVFGVQSRSDGAVAVVERLRAEFPQTSLKLIVGPRSYGSNRKVSNLINMAGFIEHDVVVIADSDIRVERDYLQRLSAALEQPGVGLVSCLYYGEAIDTLWSRLARKGIEMQFLPGVIVGLATGLARPCFGSTIALRRETLARIGGFAAFRERLADDYAMGEAVARLGLRIVIAKFLVAHTCPERSFGELFRHELRSARTIYRVDPKGFIGSGITHPLPLAILAAFLREVDLLSCCLLVIALGCRLWLQREIIHTFRLPRSPAWLLPIRDIISFIVYLGCFMTSRIDWRGHNFTLKRDGTLSSAGPAEKLETIDFGKIDERTG
jgi:ceramide glucosyltransferase